MATSKFSDSPIPSNIHTAQTIAHANQKVVNPHFSTVILTPSSILNMKVHQVFAQCIQMSLIVLSEHLLHQ
jgi:hypothetical protein